MDNLPKKPELMDDVIQFLLDVYYVKSKYEKADNKKKTYNYLEGKINDIMNLYSNWSTKKKKNGRN